jgi:hypothetical protein
LDDVRLDSRLRGRLNHHHIRIGLLLHSDWRWVALVALLNWGRLLVALLNRGRLVALLNRRRLLEYWLRVCSLRLVNVGVVRRWIHGLPARAS